MDSEARPLVFIGVLSNHFSYQKILNNSLGYEHDLMTLFADEANFTPVFVEYESTETLMKDLSQKRLQVGIGSWTNDQEQNLSDRHQVQIDNNQGVALCNQKSAFEDSKTEIYLRDQESTLASLFNDRARPTSETDGFTLMKKVLNSRKPSCFVSNETESVWFQKLAPRLNAVTLTEVHIQTTVSFAPELLKLSRQFRRWHRSQQGKSLSSLHSFYYQHLASVTGLDKKHFVKAQSDLLPEYKKWFKKYGKQFDLPWTLLAALAYQESKWQADAVSHTGVRGLMQLTFQTANHLGIEDREDPEQAIYAAAKYLRALIDAQPENLTYRNRLALALASYNMGPNNLNEVQKLATRMGTNPSCWMSLQKILPILSQPKVAQDLKYGAIRGFETLKFVDRVFSYLDLLSLG